MSSEQPIEISLPPEQLAASSLSKMSNSHQKGERLSISKRHKYAKAGLAVLAIAALAVGLSIGLTSKKNRNTAASNANDVVDVSSSYANVDECIEQGYGGKSGKGSKSGSSGSSSKSGKSSSGSKGSKSSNSSDSQKRKLRSILMNGEFCLIEMIVSGVLFISNRILTFLACSHLSLFRH